MIGRVKLAHAHNLPSCRCALMHGALGALGWSCGRLVEDLPLLGRGGAVRLGCTAPIQRTAKKEPRRCRRGQAIDSEILMKSCPTW